MTVNIKLLTSAKITKYGYPLVVQCSHNDVKPKAVIGHCLKEHFNSDLQLVTEDHPDYDLLMPKLLDIKLKGRKVVFSKITDPALALSLVLGEKKSAVTFLEFAESYVAELEATAQQFEKSGDLISRNKILGNKRMYMGAVANIKNNFPKIPVEDLDYNVLWKFRQDRLSKGNSKNTVLVYLRALRSLYNMCVKLNKLENKKPFSGVFDKLKGRSSNNKSKYLVKKDIVKLERYKTTASSYQKYIDLFLLCFYFGGCDLTDIYFLKNSQIRNGRVRFSRGKTTTETVIDLKLHPKAIVIIEKYKCAGEYLFPWRKDRVGYETFRGNLVDCLKDVQTKKNIVVEPDASYIGIKVARHSFANIGKNLKIEEDLLRELMGHERDEVDNYYKDKFPMAVRDAALFRIIG